MADKEATIYIVDLGSSMKAHQDGRKESNLDFAMRYVWDKIGYTVASSRKTWTLGVLGLRTDATKNCLQMTDGYEHISLLQDIGQMTLAGMRGLETRIAPSKTMDGDAVSAIVVAIQMMNAFTKKLKYNRKIVLVTDGMGPVDGDDMQAIATQLNKSSIQLVVLGVNFDDADYGYKEEDKPQHKAQNESLLKSLVDQCDDGAFGTVAQAVEELLQPRVKPIKLVRNYEGQLTLGNPERYASAMAINVERFPKTKVARPAAATTIVIKPELSGTQGTQSTHTLDHEGDPGGVSAVHQMRTYTVKDPNAPGGKLDVPFESLAKGYSYGSTAVPISESDFNITKLETTKSFSIIGFIPKDKYEIFFGMGEACITVARKFDEMSEVALSSLIHALYELESYAVARIVVKDGKNPALVMLMPSIEPDMECLYDVPLPFAEDVRSYQFPPLDKVITYSGKTLTQHRLLPTDELQTAMDDLVDAMDISTFGHDEDGNPAEWAPLDENYSPIIHRVNKCIRDRASYPEGAVGGIPANLLTIAQPPEKLIEQAKAKINTLIKVSDVKKVPPQVRGKRKRDTDAPISGLDIDALFAGTTTAKPAKITRENAIPEFKQLLRITKSDADIESAAKQMGEVIRTLITSSTGDSGYAQAAENMTVLREEMINFEVPALYNDFLRDLKKKLLSGALGGDRREMWLTHIKWAVNRGLITKMQTEFSDVTEEAAKEFLSSSR